MNKINPLDDLLVLEKKIGLTDTELGEFQRLYNEITRSIKLKDFLIGKKTFLEKYGQNVYKDSEGYSLYNLIMELLVLSKQSEKSGNK